MGNLLKALGRLDEAKVKCACCDLTEFFSDFVTKSLPKCVAKSDNRDLVTISTPGRLVTILRLVFVLKRLRLESNRQNI